MCYLGVEVDGVDVDVVLEDDDGVEPLVVLLQLVVDQVLQGEDSTQEPGTETAFAWK